METILSFSITTKTLNQIIDNIAKWINIRKKTKYFVCANPHSLEIAKKDPIFTQAIINADIVVPDGYGIILASKVLGGRINKRITGTDVFLGLSAKLNKSDKYSYYFMGSTDHNLKNITIEMKDKFPNIKVVGTLSPPFKSHFTEEDERKMREEINRVKPHVLWVGMTAPKQEKWIYQNKDKLDVKFIGPIGAVFDFFTGNIKRSHPWFLNHGLEWFPRLLQQPGRLWRRNFITGPMFILRVLKSKL